MEVDWRKSTEEDRRLLFKAVDTLCWKLDIDIHEVMNRVYGRPYAITTHFIGNFRRGRIKRFYALKIMEWLRKDHPAVADEVEQSCKNFRPRTIPINDNTPRTDEEVKPSWDEITYQCKPSDAVKVAILGAKKLQPKTVRYEDEIYFRLAKGYKGTILGLYQGFQDRWFVLPLGIHPMMKSVVANEKARNFPRQSRSLLPRGLKKLIGYNSMLLAFILADNSARSFLEKGLELQEEVFDEKLQELADFITNRDNGGQLFTTYFNLQRDWKKYPPQTSYEQLIAAVEGRISSIWNQGSYSPELVPREGYLTANAGCHVDGK